MSELEFDWDELPELSDISLVSYAPLQALLKCIISKINEHARYMKQNEKEEREKKLLTNEGKEILEENKDIPNELTPIASSDSSREEEFEKIVDRNEDENNEKDEEVNVKEKNKQITEENDIDTVESSHQKLEKTDPENDEKSSNLSDLLPTIQQQERESSNENLRLSNIEKQLKKPKDSQENDPDEMKKILQSIQDLDSKLSKLSEEMNEKDIQYINLHKQVQDMKTILRNGEDEAEKPQTANEEKQEEQHQEEKKESEEHNGTSSTEKLVVPHTDLDITEPFTNSFERRIKQLEEEITSLKNQNQDMSHSLSKHQIDLNSKTLEMENHKRCIDELKNKLNSMSEIPREMREATNNDPAMTNAKVSKETQVRSLTHSPERAFENLNSQTSHNNENIPHMNIESPTTSGVHPHVSTHLIIQSAPIVLNEVSKRFYQEDTDSDDKNKDSSENQESSCFNTNNVSNSGGRSPSVTIFNDDMIGQPTESKRTPQEVGTPLNPKVGEVSDEVLKEEVDKLENRLEEKLNSLNTMLQALDEKLIRKFKDIVTYVDSIKDQLYNKLRSDIDLVKRTSDKPEENTSTVPSIDKRTSLRSSLSQVDSPKKKTDESMFRKSRSRRSDSFKDSPLDSPKAAWIKNEDERSQTPPDSSLETRLLLKLNSKAEQDLMNTIQQKIDEIFERLDQLDDDIQGKANSETVANLDQLKELELKVRRKADREEVSSLIERMTQESMTNSNPDGMFALGDNIEKSHGGQITMEGDDIIRLKEAINKQASTIQQMSKQKADKLELVKQTGEKTEQIEKLERTKADANIVARKADREYVDTMLERLRKELIHSIEQLNNSTADLFAKDMNLLQNLLEEKASRQDLRKIREVLSSSQKEDTSGEGLAGKKAYRCLSCNRSIAGMRIKPLSMNFTSFVNHLPNPKSRMYPKKAYLNDSLSQTRTLSKDYPDDAQHFEQESEDISYSPIHPSSREEKSSSGKQYKEELDSKLPSIV